MNRLLGMYATSVRGVILALFVASSPTVFGAVVATRTELNSQLGASAVTEDFEGLQFPASTAKRIGAQLDSSSIYFDQGPGLVHEGVRYLQVDPEPEGLQWDRQFQYGLTSAGLVTDGRLIIDFTTPISHVGLDLFWFNAGFIPSHLPTVEVFAGDDSTLLYSTKIAEKFAPDFLFFGFSSDQGVGRISLYRTETEGLGVSPIINNLTFGFVPEPNTWVLILGGSLFCSSRRRYFRGRNA